MYCVNELNFDLETIPDSLRLYKLPHKTYPLHKTIMIYCFNAQAVRISKYEKYFHKSFLPLLIDYILYFPFGISTVTWLVHYTNNCILDKTS